MASSRIEALANRRTNLADWITAILSIFWSVWWGFFFGKVIEYKNSVIIPVPYLNPPYSLEIPLITLVIINLVICGYFASSYVHWLWNAQKVAYRSFLVKDLINGSIHLWISIILLLSSVTMMGWAIGIPDPMLFYGLILTIIWPLIVLMTIWRG